ncbi:MAG: SMP-30/gluconolactonase/LRE family protein [Pseudomonadota bacterium]
MKKLFQAVAATALLAAILTTAAWFLSPVRPADWAPDPVPPLEGPYATNQKLSRAAIINLGMGPEDVERGPDGRFYTGLLDGRILSFTSAADVQEFANTGGRPLGMAFDTAGQLIVADADRGLLAIAPDGTINVLVDANDDDSLRFTDDLVIGNDGVIWFTNASQRFGVHRYMYDFLEASRTGEVIRFDPSTGETARIADDLFFANGIALGPDDNFLLVNETGTGVIHRFWLRGDRAGERDVFASELPGHPDNLSFNGRDTFWVAMPAVRGGPLEQLGEKPWLRRLLGALPQAWLVPPDRHAFVIGLSLEGEPVHNLQWTDGTLHSITSVNEYDGALYLGTIADDHVGRYQLTR